VVNRSVFAANDFRRVCPEMTFVEMILVQGDSVFEPDSLVFLFLYRTDYSMQC
jgi:hypothetical protein